MRVKSVLLLLFAVLCFTASTRRHVTLFMIGDSTMADKNINHGSPERGWGMVLQGFFDEGVVVDNHAQNGRSSKSFIDEGRWQKVLDKLQPGDYVVIQFGHNDEKANPDRHTNPGSTFDDNLRRFVRETKAKGATPILMNAVVRRNFYAQNDNSVDDESLRDKAYSDENINSDTLIDTHGAYLAPPRYVASEMNVPFVDANKISHDIEQSHGVLGSRKLHLWFKPGEHPAIPKGRRDNTHYSAYGAHLIAGALVDAIGEQVPKLKKHICHFDYIVSKRGRGNYMTLQEAINSAPQGKKTKILILDGKWQKPSIPKGKKIKFVKRFDAIVE